MFVDRYAQSDNQSPQFVEEVCVSRGVIKAMAFWTWRSCSDKKSKVMKKWNQLEKTGMTEDKVTNINLEFQFSVTICMILWQSL